MSRALCDIPMAVVECLIDHGGEGIGHMTVFLPKIIKIQLNKSFFLPINPTWDTPPHPEKPPVPHTAEPDVV